VPDDEPDGRSFEDVARALADEVNRAVERLLTLDLDDIARAANEEAERTRRWIEDLARSLRPTGDAAMSPDDAPAHYAAPHPLAMPTAEQGAALSDSFPLAARWEGMSRSAIARHFGDELADAVLALPPNAWSAPIASPFGLHIVWVHARHAERTPPVDSIRGQLVQIVIEERAAARLAAGLDRLRRLYQIRIEWQEARR